METIDLLRTCLMCSQELRGRDPRLLPCLHSFCKSCLLNIIQKCSYVSVELHVTEEGIISCPVCKQTCFTTDVVENFFLKDFLKINPIMARSCFECMEKKPAHSLCTSCNKWLCNPCTEEHRHAEDTGDHLLSVSHKGYSGTEGGSGEFSLFCPLHNQEAMKLFCETCDVLTCRNCLILEHKDHRFRYLDEALQNQRILLENVTTRVEEKKIAIQATAKQIEERLFEVKHLRRKVENQIKMAKMVLINEIHKRTNTLLDQLERISTERTQKLEQQLQSIVVLNRQLEHVQNFINWAVCGKNNVPFLFSKELIVFQMQRLLETSCSSEVSPPWKIRFSWEPSFWTKQLSSLGCIVTESGQIPRPDTSGYGNMQELQSSYYPGHQQPPPPPQEVMNESHKFPCAAQGPSPTCCTQCRNTSQVHKGQVSQPSVNYHQNFRHPPDMQQQHHYQSHHLPRQYNTQQGAKQHPLRMTQPWLPEEPQPELENSSLWLGKQQMQRQQCQQTAHPVCVVPPQDVHAGHPQQLHAQSALQNSSVPMQLGHIPKLHFNCLQKQQQQQQQAAAEADGTHEQVVQQSLDIIHQQFELEQMQKGLEILLQSQPASLQINQNKPPQHVQQTIVGQINYIVRQPAPVQQPNQEEVQQVCDNSSVLEDPPPEFPPLSSCTLAASQSQPLNEQVTATAHLSDTMDTQLSPLVSNQLRKRSACNTVGYRQKPYVKRRCSRSASVSIVGFSSAPETEPTAARLSRSVDPQMQGECCHLDTQSLSQSCSSDVLPEAMPTYSPMEINAMNDLQPGTPDNLATDDALLGNAMCKIEHEEDFGSTLESHSFDSSVNQLTLPIQNDLEEPINLSVRKDLRIDAPSIPIPAVPANTISCLPSLTKHLKSEADSGNVVKKEITVNIQNNQTIRAFIKEQKIPYVRLERLKICAPDSGQHPVFKLQPQNTEQDGTFLLLIEYGAQSTSMSIKANPDSYPSPPPPSLTPQLFESELPPPMSLQLHEPPQLPLSQLPSLVPITSSCNPVASPKEETASEVPSGPPDLGPEENNPNSGSPAMSAESDPIENEDFCAVCKNGGEMLCCDHCPKVFHLACHVPALLSFPVGEWVCTLCRNLLNPEVEYDCENTRQGCSTTEDETLNVPDAPDQRRCEKLVLSLYCNSLSPPFQEPVSPLARHYYQIIKRPVDLSTIRRKLQKKNRKHYSSPEELVLDMRLMFWNCAKFNYPDSEVAEAGRSLQMFFEDRLKEIYPDKTFPLPQQEESDSEEIGSENSQQLAKGFHWPSYGHECTQPKRRRRHTVNYKAKESDLC